MKLHANAALSLNQRRRMVGRVVEQGWSLTKAAEAAEVSERTCSKWVARYRAEGEAGLLDRSSAPRSIPHRTPEERVEVDRGAAAAADDRRRDRRVSGDGALDRLGGADADRAGQALAGWSRSSRRTATSAATPGELLHVDVKKLGRITRRRAPRHRPPRQPERQPPTRAGARRRTAGSSSTSASTTPPAWPTSRSSPTRRPPPPSASCAARSPSTPPRHHRRARDDRQRRLPTARPSHALACRALGIRHLRTRPYRPRTNGKAERFIRTMLAGWAYGAIYATSPNAPPPLTAGSGPTTIAAHTAPSATSRPSLASTS